MKYGNTISGIFLERPNRFIARVDIDGHTESVHVKNTGRCGELLQPGARVTLTAAENPRRSTGYDLISVEKSGVGWVNIDSQAPNAAVKEWLKSAPELFPDITYLKPEFVYGRSRVDFYLERGKRRSLMEVKGCTLEIGKVGYFPDAPTERGVRHLRELAAALDEGYECLIAFVIAVPGVTEVLPNRKTHPEFGTALDEAVKAGVKVLYLPCEVRPDEISIKAGILRV